MYRMMFEIFLFSYKQVDLFVKYNIIGLKISINGVLWF